MHLSENRVTPEFVIVDHHFSIKGLPQIGGTWPILKPTSFFFGLKMVGNPPHCIPIAFKSSPKKKAEIIHVKSHFS